MTENQQPQGLPESRELTRRKVVVAGTGAVAAVGLGGAFAADAFASEAGGGRQTPAAATSGAEVCYRLTSEAVEGPYYIDADKIRRDVTEDREGIPLRLDLRVIDSETCRPVRNAAVDIWHCDASGVYSGYESQGSGGGGPAPTGEPPTGEPPSGGPGGGNPGGHQEPTDDTRYLRGTWRTDRHGRVAFRTVFPGWYRGRCVHIHVKVHVDGEWTDAGYEGGH
ncbi:dioxygenase family protein, partial [Streptomyces adustus]